jgi:aminomethyltransferase
MGSTVETEALKRTALHGRHAAAGAKLVPFGGWEMPLHYTGIVEEHHAVRRSAGIFDVSHMGKVMIGGPGAEEFVSRVQCNLPAGSGRGAYGHILDERGMIIDDTIVYNISRPASTEFLAIPNAATKDGVLQWFRTHSGGETRFVDITADAACIAVQGPKAEAMVSRVTGVGLSGWKFMDVRHLDTAVGQAFLMRSGYTGEDGFELVAPNPIGQKFWDAVLEVGRPEGLLPCGLGARDTLRMEKAFLLSGQDFHGDRTPLETNASWVVKWEHDFIGKAALERQKAAGPREKFRGLVTAERRAIPRQGSRVRLPGGDEIGAVTSGTFSPTLQRGIGLGYIRSDVKAGSVEVEVRGEWHAAEITRTPFV